jgi:hypothetical protein
MKIISKKSILLLIGAIIVTSSCVLPNMPEFTFDFDKYEDSGDKGAGEEEIPQEPASSEPFQQISKTGNSVTLLWDPSPSYVQSYILYYREHGTDIWYILGEVEAEKNPSYEITSSSLYGKKLDFAAIAVDVFDNESEMHTSLDATASPETGWYLFWDK